jgi:VanZ family protein
MKRTFLNWALVVVFAYVVFYLSSQPIVSPVQITNIDLLAHAFFYCVLAILVARALQISRRTKRIAVSILLVILVTFYGASLEWYQSYLPTRTASVADGVANSFGSFLGITLYLIYHRWTKSKQLKGNKI